MLSLSLAVSSSVLADELDSIIIEDVLQINPNSAEPEQYNTTVLAQQAQTVESF